MKKLYHLHNSFGEFDEYTTDESKIVMIYIDEVLQCAETNMINGNLKEAEKMLEDIMVLCGQNVENQIDENEIDKLVEKLNREHYWLIETSEMI